MLCEIVLLAENDLQAAAGGVPGNAGAIDAAAHHQEIDDLGFAQRSLFPSWLGRHQERAAVIVMPSVA
jgi:hypothetical protein